MKEEILIYTHRFEKRCGWLGANQQWRREGRAETSCNFPRLVLTVWFNTFFNLFLGFYCVGVAGFERVYSFIRQ